ncbi:25273_t:CDS:2, partial [Gigaspora rosea]
MWQNTSTHEESSNGRPNISTPSSENSGECMKLSTENGQPISIKRSLRADEPHDMVEQQVKNKKTQSGKNVNHLVNIRKSMSEKRYETTQIARLDELLNDIRNLFELEHGYQSSARIKKDECKTPDDNRPIEIDCYNEIKNKKVETHCQNTNQNYGLYKFGPCYKNDDKKKISVDSCAKDRPNKNKNKDWNKKYCWAMRIVSAGDFAIAENIVRIFVKGLVEAKCIAEVRGLVRTKSVVEAKGLNNANI